MRRASFVTTPAFRNEALALSPGGNLVSTNPYGHDTVDQQASIVELPLRWPSQECTRSPHGVGFPTGDNLFLPKAWAVRFE